jgi:Fe2+ transport system protein FeoA
MRHKQDGAGSIEADAPLDLTGLRDGESARVVGFHGGREVGGRLEAMGMGLGSIIHKRSSSLRRGPIVIARGSSQVAIGYAMAQGVLVERIA